MTTNIFVLCCHLLDLLNRLRKYFVGMVRTSLHVFGSDGVLRGFLSKSRSICTGLENDETPIFDEFILSFTLSLTRIPWQIIAQAPLFIVFSNLTLVAIMVILVIDYVHRAVRRVSSPH